MQTVLGYLNMVCGQLCKMTYQLIHQARKGERYLFFLALGTIDKTRLSRLLLTLTIKSVFLFTRKLVYFPLRNCVYDNVLFSVCCKGFWASQSATVTAIQSYTGTYQPQCCMVHSLSFYVTYWEVTKFECVVQLITLC